MTRDEERELDLANDEYLLRNHQFEDFCKSLKDIDLPFDDEEQMKRIKKIFEESVASSTNSSIETVSQMYQMIADEEELKWFFKHVVQRPAVNESYSAVLVSRHKKLTKEEQEVVGLTRKESEFLSTVTFKNFYGKDEDNEWTFDRFLKTLKRFNVDKYAYTTSKGEPIPQKTLAVVFYVNPCDDVTVADELSTKIRSTKTALSKALLGGKSYEECKETYRLFSNLESDLKHLKAQCKGATYWMDFDIDVPKWFKEKKEIFDEESYNYCIMDDPDEVMDVYKSDFIYEDGYYSMLDALLHKTFGLSNYVVIDTSGGYHVLVKTSAIKSNPHDFCRKVEGIYRLGLEKGEEPYLDENGNCKFECIITASHQKFNPEEDEEAKEAVKKLEDLQARGEITQREFKVMRRGLYDSLKTKKENNKSSIPGIPLPGTYQYGRPVTVLNKEDFE